MPNKMIVNLTPTGMVPTRSMSKHAPLSLSEITESIHEAVELGITMVHLHVRDEAESPSSDPEIYAEAIRRIRAFAPELIICASISGRIEKEFEQRAAPLFLDGDVKPDAASLTLSSMNFVRTASENSPEIIKKLALTMLELGIMPELEVFDVGMLNYAHHLIGKKLLQGPFYVNVILGNIATAQMDLSHVGVILNQIPYDWFWSLGGIGDTQLTANAVAIAMGGGVRVGLEDNLYWDSARTRQATNRELIQRVHDLAEIHQREIMPPGELRTKLELLPGFGQYGRKPMGPPANTA
jgi:uncharacterized protein (DUF849 family)